MALVVNDRVKETTTTTGTGTINLGGAQTNFETFVAGVGNSNTTYYAIVHRSAAEFEIGLGTITDASPDTLARTTIISSSNSDSAVNFSAGTKDVFCTLPASKAVFEDASSNVTLPADLSVGDDLTVEGGVIDLKTNSGSRAQLKLYCESSNAHAQKLQAQPHASGSTNTLTLPDGSDQELVGTTATQTLTNKTITAPVLSGSSSAAGSILFKEDTDNGTNAVTLIGPASTADVTITLPAAADTLVGKATTDTLTNKTLTSPKINEDVAVTSTATEINLLDGVTATTAELNILDGVTSTAAELNILDGVTSTAAELNILDGVTATAAELNILDGVTSTAAELNILDGVTATAAELNYSDLATLGTTAASKVFTADANGLTKISGAALYTEDTLTDGSTVAWDVIASPVAKLTMAGNRTISAPSGTTPAAGQFVSLLLIQDGTGSRTITWNAVYEFTEDTAPTLTTTANKGDLFVFRYNGAKWLEVGRNLNLTLS